MIAVRLLVALSVLVVALAAAVAARAAASPECTTGQLGLTARRPQGAAGTIGTVLVLANRSGRTCHVRGYPGVSLLDARGHQLGTGATRAAGAVRTITLRPGGAASARLRTADGACGGDPAHSTFVRVFPPDRRQSIRTELRLPACEPRISPLQPGRPAS